MDLNVTDDIGDLDTEKAHSLNEKIMHGDITGDEAIRILEKLECNFGE